MQIEIQVGKKWKKGARFREYERDGIINRNTVLCKNLR
jgi:hypothetical protein